MLISPLPDKCIDNTCMHALLDIFSTIFSHFIVVQYNVAVILIKAFFYILNYTYCMQYLLELIRFLAYKVMGMCSISFDSNYELNIRHFWPSTTGAKSHATMLLKLCSSNLQI